MLKNFFIEFKKFAMRGNVTDMAIGIIIGSAFGKVVDSLVKDIIMPPIGILLGKIDLTNLFFTLKSGIPFGPYQSLSAAQSAGAITVNVGAFLNTNISFLIISLCIFLAVKAANSHAETKPHAVECPFCCSQISSKAAKCPHCTSDLRKEPGISAEGSSGKLF
ncbi:MAG: large conductance mechanosensitive channel protein MscL [Puniceicoccales bacterium]|jgi:large conductance mechanosensitive channel|nr:large conductance mechanosensitive channel protein MscL [Puniceicoccales bacterium]